MEQEGFPEAEQRGGGPSASYLIVRVPRSQLRGRIEVTDLIQTQKLQHSGYQTYAGLAQVTSS